MHLLCIYSFIDYLLLIPAIISPSPNAAATPVDCKPIHPLQVKPSPPSTPAARYWHYRVIHCIVALLNCAENPSPYWAVVP
ncbi:hypothetical protein CDAR_249661 [Caerostris darwini]|uniref:Secreted protein n=1 Tax=Caerostris darwini TaxID=1538125 RepID=A0AAV4RLJ4_9ARAC|nr:hypothetical protein CDAR_249661 [Caerostris darwini]